MSIALLIWWDGNYERFKLVDVFPQPCWNLLYKSGTIVYLQYKTANMAYDEFIQLTESERYIAWLALSVEVARFKNFHYSFHLYQLSNFYIEVKVHDNDFRQTELNAFTDSEKLDPYLRSVDIASITGYV